MDLSRYLGLFVSDAREHLASLGTELVRLEAAPDEGARRLLLDAIFRHLHSLKGSAATMGFEAIAQLAHLSEALIGRARDRGEAPSGDEIDLLLETVDALEQLVGEAEGGTRPSARPVLADRLARLMQPAPAPAATETGSAPFVLPDFPVTRARIRVSPRSTSPAARAFLALRKLEALADIVHTEPAREVIREGRTPVHEVVVTLRGEVDAAAVAMTLARVPDIVSVENVAEPLPAQKAPQPAPMSAASATEQAVRVKVELLDQLLELAGELVLASARLRESVRPLPEQARKPLEAETDRLRLLVRELNGRVLVARQTPVSQLFDRLPRAVRDLARRLERPLELQTTGGDTTLDRGLVEALADPLLHIIRNAADHGIETPEERSRLGKPAAGRITVAARRERERVVVEVRDDGHGFDLARLKAKAVAAGLVNAEEAERMSPDETHRLALLPGLSTREAATDLSGRGVGMDAVLRDVEQIGGTVRLSSEPGKGSLVRLEVPATVSVVNLLLVGLGHEVFGVPMGRVLVATEADLSARGGEGFQARHIQVGGERVQSFSLGKLLGLPEQPVAGPRPFVVVDAEGSRTAVGVDRVLGQEEVVLRPLSMPLERIRGLAGTAILGSGRPIFVLDVPRLVA